VRYPGRPAIGGDGAPPLRARVLPAGGGGGGASGAGRAGRARTRRAPVLLGEAAAQSIPREGAAAGEGKAEQTGDQPGGNGW
jgi:hypothetical protein